MLRAERFGSEFFTGEGSQKILASFGGGVFSGGFGNHETWQHVQAQIVPVPPEGYGGSSGVEELEAQSLLKAIRAQTAVDDTFRLLATDLLTGTRWLDVRKNQDPTRRIRAGADRGVAGVPQGHAVAARSGRAAAGTGRGGNHDTQLSEEPSGVEFLSVDGAGSRGGEGQDEVTAGAGIRLNWS